jgi:DNA-binding NarL/FixJ family response regulator
MKRARILLADDHQLTLAGIHRLLETSYDVVAEVNDGAALVKAAAVLQPDLIVLDISMPQMNGLDAAAQIRKSMPEAKLLFLTMHANAKFLAAALSAGGHRIRVENSRGGGASQSCRQRVEGWRLCFPGYLR